VEQINVNPAPDSDDGNGRAADGNTLITGVIALLVVVALLWFVFGGPLQGARDRSPAKSDLTISTTIPAPKPGN
jgi:hypothetical protein